MTDASTRTFYTTARVRAGDLTTTDFAFIEGRWMAVFGVFTGPEDLDGGFGPGASEAATEGFEWLKDAAAQARTLAEWNVLIRFADDTKSFHDDLADRWLVLPQYALVEIQVPVPDPAPSPQN